MRSQHSNRSWIHQGAASHKIPLVSNSKSLDAKALQSFPHFPHQININQAITTTLVLFVRSLKTQTSKITTCVRPLTSNACAHRMTLPSYQHLASYFKCLWISKALLSPICT